MIIGHYLGAIDIGERQLAEAFKTVAERHSREFEIEKGCEEFSRWATGHREALKPMLERYGQEQNPALQQLRGSLFRGSRAGSLGLLHDLQDLSLMANSLRTHYTILHQALVSVKDPEMEKVCDELGEHVNEEINWLCTQIKLVSPQAVTVTPNPGQEAAASMPKQVTPAAFPDQVWAPLGSAILALIVGLLGIMFGRPWLLPSLGPTIFLQTEKPADPSSRFYNVVLGHLLGLGAGFAGVFLFNAYNDPVVLQAHRLTYARLGAAAVALALTILLTLLLRANHPPAGATTLLVVLGSIKTMQDALNLTIGVLIVAAIGELIRLWRTGRFSQMSVQPKVPPTNAGKT